MRSRDTRALIIQLLSLLASTNSKWEVNMIETWRIFLVIFLVLGASFSAYMLWLNYSRKFVLRMCKTVALDDINYVIEYAESKGNKALAERFLRQARNQYGHSSLREGHLIWIRAKVDDRNNCLGDAVPSFANVGEARKSLREIFKLRLPFSFKKK